MPQAYPTAGADIPGEELLIHAGPSSFELVAGLSVLRRNVVAALRAGLRPRVIAPAVEAAERVRAELDADPRTRGVPLTVRKCPQATARTVADGLLLVAAPGESPRLERLAFVRDRTGAARAERKLIERIRAWSAATDGPLARYDRHISTRLSLPLARLGVPPNAITVTGTFIGLTGAWFLSQGGYWAAVVGAALFWVAVVLDGCDGEVARLTLRESRAGQVFDVVTDNIVHVAVFAGIATGGLRSGAVPRAIPLLCVLLAGLAVAAAAGWAVLIRSNSRPPAEGGGLPRVVLRMCEAVMNRDFVYLVLVLALVGKLPWFLWGSAVGTWAYAIVLLAGRWAVRHRETRPGTTVGAG